MTKPPEIDYMKVVLGIITSIATILIPFLIAWLVKNYRVINKSNEHNSEMKKKLEDEIKKQSGLNETFRNEINSKVNSTESKISKEVDRKISSNNYELDRSRKLVDSINSKLIRCVDDFDKKSKELSVRLKSELLSKEEHYKEMSKIKDSFFRELINVRSEMYNTKPSMENKLTKDLLILHKKIEILTKGFTNEKITNDKKHNLTKRLLQSGLSERRKLERESSVNNENYNKLLEGLNKINKE